MKPYRTVVLTGASSGFGEGFALRLGQLCEHLVLIARREQMLKELAGRIEGAQVHVLPADVAEIDDYVPKLSASLAELPPCDLVILNAGVGKAMRLTKPQADHYRWTYGVNLFGAIATLDAVLPGMLAENKGHIVGISSLAAYRGLPRNAAYASSKSALWRALEGIRCELAKTKIHVTTIHPGFVETPMTEANDKKSMPFLLPCDVAVDKMMWAIVRKKAHYAYPWQFRWLSRFIRLIPDGLFARIVGKNSGSAVIDPKRIRD